MYMYLYLYRRSGTILQDVVVVQVVQVVFRTDCCGHTWVVLGWDGMRMGWNGLGTGTWDVLLSRTGSIGWWWWWWLRLVDWTGLLDILDVRGY